MPIDFYRKPRSANNVDMGPFHPPTRAFIGPGAAPGDIQSVIWTGVVSRINATGGHQIRGDLLDSQARSKFPGVFCQERPSRGRIDCPAAAAITNHSTLTIHDGINTRVFEFVSGGVVGPGHTEVNIAAAVTPADVANALKAALDTWTSSVFVAIVNPQGWLSTVSGGTVFLVQSPVAKHDRTPGLVAFFRLTWVFRTWGNTSGSANTPIVASVPGEWNGTAGHGTLLGMAGAKKRKAGIPVRPVGKMGRKWQCVNEFFPKLQILG